jgi:SAM-dependent methyltransferase
MTGRHATAFSLYARAFSRCTDGTNEKRLLIGRTMASAGLAAAALLMGAPALGQRGARAPDIYFVGTPQPVVKAMLQLAEVTASDVVYDLGSGDGRIVIIAAQEYGARGVGIEIQPHLVEVARQTAREGAVETKALFIEGDFFTADISGATVVMMWLSTPVNARLEPKLRRELRPGTRIVSHQFPIGQWKPDRTVHADYDDTDLFLWRIPGPDR